MRSLASLIAAVLATLALAACGGDDDSGGDEPATTTGAEKPAQQQQQPAAGGDGTACFESWNAKASPDVKGYTIAGVSEQDSIAGTYKGKEFEGSTEGDTVTVKPGDCVVAQVTTTETEYVFVESAPTAGGPKAWHNLEDEGSPLAEPTEAQLDGVAKARLKGYGPEGNFEPAP
jgi:hypothetical protein